jgi:hypothetical protein
MKISILIPLLLVGLFSLPAHTEPQPQSVTLYFQNGDYLTGEAIELTEQSFEIQSAWGEKLSVPRSAISGWTLQGDSYGAPWTLDRKNIGTVMTKEPGMEAPVIWGDDGELAIESPPSIVFSRRLPEEYRSPIEIEMTMVLLDENLGLDLFIVPENDIGLWRSPAIMVRIKKNTITCISYLSDQGNRDARYKKSKIPQPAKGPLTIRLTLNPEQNQFHMQLNGEDFLSWQEPEDALPPGFSFKRVDWRFTGNLPVMLNEMSIRLAGIPPDEEERIPPFVELANGDIIISKSMRWDEKGLWLEMEGVPPFAMPPQRAASVWLANPTPPENDPSTPQTLIKTGKGQSLLTLTIEEETEEAIRYSHPALPNPITVPKNEVHTRVRRSPHLHL